MQNNTNVKNFINHFVQNVDELKVIDVQAGTTLQWFVQTENKNYTKLIRYQIVIYEHAKVQIFFTDIAAHNLDLEIELKLVGKFSQAELYGVYALNHNEKIRIKTVQIHEGQDSESIVLVKGMTQDQAEAIVHSLIRILPQAHRSNASQENKNIMLSQQSKVQAQPSIEVLQHDVQCAHATATSQFDKKHAWYLQSKGLDAIQTKRLLVQSFFELIISKMKNPKQIMELICQKMILMP